MMLRGQREKQARAAKIYIFSFGKSYVGKYEVKRSDFYFLVLGKKAMEWHRGTSMNIEYRTL